MGHSHCCEHPVFITKTIFKLLHSSHIILFQDAGEKTVIFTKSSNHDRFSIHIIWKWQEMKRKAFLRAIPQCKAAWCVFFFWTAEIPCILAIFWNKWPHLSPGKSPPNARHFHANGCHGEWPVVASYSPDGDILNQNIPEGVIRMQRVIHCNPIAPTWLAQVPCSGEK